jgi:hypothetical protein
MKTWRITYPDGTTEDVQGFQLRIWDGVLTIEQNSSSYNRQPRSWPLTAIRSWEER